MGCASGWFSRKRRSSRIVSTCFTTRKRPSRVLTGSRMRNASTGTVPNPVDTRAPAPKPGSDHGIVVTFVCSRAFTGAESRKTCLSCSQEGLEFADFNIYNHLLKTKQKLKNEASVTDNPSVFKLGPIGTDNTVHLLHRVLTRYATSPKSSGAFQKNKPVKRRCH